MVHCQVVTFLVIGVNFFAWSVFLAIRFSDTGMLTDIITNSIFVVISVWLSLSINRDSLREYLRANSGERQAEHFLLEMRKVSHDIRTPMASIRSTLEQMRENLESSIVKSGDASPHDERDKLHSDFARKIEGCVTLMNNVVENCLYSREAQHPVYIWFNLREKLSGLVEVLRDSSALKGSTIMKYEIESSVAERVYLPANFLIRILSNLLTNSAKFTFKGQIVLTVTVVQQAGLQVGLQFSVEDTGVGMTEEQCRQCLDLGFSGSKDEGGLGIGLFVVNEMLSGVGSSLSIRSTVGEGTVMSFVLDTEAEDSHSPLTEKRGLANEVTHRVAIHITAGTLAQKVRTRQLQSHHFDVHELQHVGDSLNGPVSLVVVSVHVIDHSEYVQKLRSLLHTKEVPIIFLTEATTALEAENVHFFNTTASINWSSFKFAGAAASTAVRRSSRSIYRTGKAVLYVEDSRLLRER